MLGSDKKYVGISLIPQNTVTPSVEGDIRLNSTTHKLEVYNTALDYIVTELGTATLTNKTITLKDGNFTLQNSADVTKQALFSLAGNTTGTTRTYTLPNATTAIVATDVAQTLSLKTFSDPLTMTVGATPSNPTASNNKLYFKSDNFLYSLTSAGSETLLGNSLTNPMTTGGDIIYGGIAGTPTRLPNGTAGYALEASGGTAAPVWAIPRLPTASITMYGASSAPSGWLMCDGTSYLRATYADLFAIIGTTYGAADGTHFNVPNTQGVFVRGAGSQTISAISYTGVNGTVEGDKFQGHYHTITDPGHTHTITDPNHSHTITDVAHTHSLQSNTGGSISNLTGATQIGGLTASTAAGMVAGVPYVSSDNTGITAANSGSTGITAANSNTTGITAVAPITNGSNGTPRTGSETQPANIGLYYIIKI